MTRIVIKPSLPGWPRTKLARRAFGGLVSLVKCFGSFGMMVMRCQTKCQTSSSFVISYGFLSHGIEQF